MDGPDHEFYFAIEADDIKKLYDPMKDLHQIADNEIVPVVGFSDSVALAKKLGLQK